MATLGETACYAKKGAAGPGSLPVSKGKSKTYKKGMPWDAETSVTLPGEGHLRA